MLIGLAIDFGVHLITRYEEELRHGRTEAEALTKALQRAHAWLLVNHAPKPDSGDSSQL